MTAVRRSVQRSFFCLLGYPMAQGTALLIDRLPDIFGLQAADDCPSHHEVTDCPPQGQHPGLYRAHVSQRCSGTGMPEGDLAGCSGIDPGAGHRGLGGESVDDADERFAHCMG